jgi:diguanylate cyclase (GGDEF)-like protein
VIALARHPALPFVIWFVLEMGVACVRLTVTLDLMQRVRTQKNKGFFGYFATDISIMTGLLWAAIYGFGSMIIMLQNDLELFAIAVGVCTSVSAGVAARNPSAPRLNIVYILLLNLPIAIGSLFNPDRFFVWIFILEPAFLFPLIRLTKQFHLDYVKMTIAQLENYRYAYRCSLTGLPNRRMFYASLADLVQTASAACHALLLIDLDGFKAVNDTFGHQTGDEVLIQVADRLRLVVGKDGVCARLGGDEFVLLVNTQTRPVNELAAAIVDSLAKPFQLRETTRPTIGASIGIALIGDVRSTDAISTLLRRADEALYVAKSAGKGTFRYSRDVATETSTIPDAA